jgi:hypothetical protein
MTQTMYAHVNKWIKKELIFNSVEEQTVDTNYNMTIKEGKNVLKFHSYDIQTQRNWSMMIEIRTVVIAVVEDYQESSWGKAVIWMEFFYILIVWRLHYNLLNSSVYT